MVVVPDAVLALEVRRDVSRSFFLASMSLVIDSSVVASVTAEFSVFGSASCVVDPVVLDGELPLPTESDSSVAVPLAA